jgi:hypothetical protein
MRPEVPEQWLRKFVPAATSFRNWLDEFDPLACGPSDVIGALQLIANFDLPSAKDRIKRPRLRFFRPNQKWQINQRKASRLFMNGYRTGNLPNDDGTKSVLCSLAYDLCDFYEVCELVMREFEADPSRLARLSLFDNWNYIMLRIDACVAAVCVGAPPDEDPFQLLPIYANRVRFVSWRTSSLTHATEDPVDARGATTLCEGRFAYHKHTQQQWTCYACRECRRYVDGRPLLPILWRRAVV